MKDRLIDIITIGIARACVKSAGGEKVDQAKEIADVLIENGAIIPPVKVGQTCYYIDRADLRRPIKEGLCVEIQDGYGRSVVVLQDQVTKHRFAHIFDDVGRTIFLTRAEAEFKLKEITNE